jgi:hypothetical protein
MSDALATYLRDHLAGATSAIEVVEMLRDQQAGTPLGDFAVRLLEEITADRAVLEELAQRVAAGSHPLKEAGAWMGAKVARIKLGHLGGELGTYEALEFLALGIQGKLALWRALQRIAPVDERVRSLDLERLVGRAQAQYAEVEERRLAHADAAFRARPA